MLESLTPATYLKWQRYFWEEPFGPHRDNLHAAVIAGAVLEPHIKRGQKIDFDRFMIRRRELDAPNRVTNFIRALFAMSKPGKPRKQKK